MLNKLLSCCAMSVFLSMPTYGSPNIIPSYLNISSIPPGLYEAPSDMVELTNEGKTLTADESEELFASIISQTQWQPFLQQNLVKKYTLQVSGKVILFVIAVDIIQAYQVGVFENTFPIPAPIIFKTYGPSAIWIGQLPEGFPEDPPGKLRVFFGDWQNNFPQIVNFYEAGTSALNPHWVAMRLKFHDNNYYDEDKVYTATARFH